MKKVISIVLCVLMLTGMLVMSASAATISYAELSVTAPADGESPDFYPEVIEPSDGSIEVQTGYTSGDYINGVAWYDVEANKYLTPDDEFEGGKTYNCYIWIQPVGSNTLISSFSVDLDGAYDYGCDGVVSNEARVYGSFDCAEANDYELTAVNYEFDFSIAPGELVQFGNIWQMGEGRHIDKTYNQDGFVNCIKWTSWSMGNAHGKGDRYYADTEYTLSLRIVADGECYFASNVVSKMFAPNDLIDGNVVEWDSSYIVVEYEFANNGCYPKGWHKASDGKWLYYYTDEGDEAQNCWKQIGGKWYPDRLAEDKQKVVLFQQVRRHADRLAENKRQVVLF